MRVRHLFILLLLILTACTSTPTPAATPADAQDPSPTVTPTVTSTPTITPSETARPTFTPRPTYTFTPAASLTPTRTPDGTFTPTPLISSSGPFQPAYTLAEVVPGLIQNIAAPENHSIWVTGLDGMARIDRDTGVFSVERFNGRILGAGPDGRVWMLPYDGSTIMAWDGTGWTEYNRHSGWILPAEIPPLPAQPPALAADPRGGFWLSTAKDVRYFDGKYWTVHPASLVGSDLPWLYGYSSSFSIAVDPISSTVLAASCHWNDGQPTGGGGVRIFQGWHWVDAKFPVRKTCITHLAADGKGSLYAATLDRLYRYDPAGKTWTMLEPPSLAVTGWQYAMLVDLAISPDGTLWPLWQVNDASGNPAARLRYKLNEETWALVREQRDTAQQLLRFTSPGDTWLFEPGKIYLWEGEQWTLKAEINWQDAAVSPDGLLWVITDVKEKPILWSAAQH